MSLDFSNKHNHDQFQVVGGIPKFIIFKLLGSTSNYLPFLHQYNFQALIRSIHIQIIIFTLSNAKIGSKVNLFFNS